MVHRQIHLYLDIFLLCSATHCSSSMPSFFVLVLHWYHYLGVPWLCCLLIHRFTKGLDSDRRLRMWVATNASSYWPVPCVFHHVAITVPHLLGCCLPLRLIMLAWLDDLFLDRADPFPQSVSALFVNYWATHFSCILLAPSLLPLNYYYSLLLYSISTNSAACVLYIYFMPKHKSTSAMLQPVTVHGPCLTPV